LCHTPQTTDPDTGNTVDFKVMVHKIHQGSGLPSVQAGVPYQIIGFGQSVNDFSSVVFPADVRTCEKCHDPNSGAAQASAWLLKPSRAACGSCHDNVNFATGENHSADSLPEISDNQCANCHTPQGELEFDASIKGAHTIPTLSTSLPGTVFALIHVDNGTAGKNPAVTFTIKDKSGVPIPLSAMARLALVMAGPTSDYASAIREDATKATTNGDGSFTYTFQAAIPATATGSLTVGIEGFRNVKLLPGTKKEMTVRDAGTNQVLSFSVDGSPVAQRRTIVAIENCNQCHSNLSHHGGSRNQTVMCVLCHNPNGTDEAARKPATEPPESIDFRTMIHKIHTGENLTSPYTVSGTDFTTVRFPGDRRDCEKCHVAGSEQLPLNDNLLSVVTPRGYTNPTPPTTAACLACHTDKSAASHALSNSNSLGEACAVCHGPNADFSIDKVHAR
jgi:OmcA/MtrC family decaheme c-type cytochrome